MKTGLVLEGGGFRGLYTVGVLDALEEGNIRFPYVIGVSAGACNGLSYVSGQTGRGYRINTAYTRDKRYCGLYPLLKEKSMFGMNYIFDTIPHELDPFDYDAFQAAAAEYVVGVTDVETGEPAYFGKEHLDHDCTVVRASSAIPCFSPMVEYCGRKYLDGGTSDPIPLQKAAEDGCQRAVVVLTRPRDYVKPPEKLRWYYKRAFRRYPAMIRLLDRRHEIYAEEQALVARWEKDGRAVVIAPKTALEVRRFEKDMGKLEAAYRRGKCEAREKIPEIRRLLGGDGV